MIDVAEKVFANEIPELVQNILPKCYTDLASFCLTFLPDNFYIPFSSLHMKAISAINEKKKKKRLAICGTRGLGKTTLIRAIGDRAIVLAEKKFIVYVGKSETHAVMQTENMKRELSGKEIKGVFGRIKAQTPGDIEESWSKKAWVAMIGHLCNCGATASGLCENCGTVGDAHYTFVLPRGAGQQVRGLVWVDPLGHNVRPDLYLFDDMEDPELVKSEEWRNSNKEWFFSDPIKCPSMFDKDWEMYYIDTLKHEDSLMQLLLDASDWDSITVSVCDDNYKSLAPDFMTTEEIAEDVKSYREKGMLDVFAREIMCKPISKEDAAFKQEYFVYYKEDEKEFIARKGKLINVVLVDPAKTVKKHSAETGFVVWGVDIELGTLYLRYAAGERLHPDKIWDRAIELALFYSASVIGFEDTGLGEFATYPLMNEIMRRGLTIEVEPLKAKRGGRVKEAKGFEAGKTQRVGSLVGYYRKGLIRHNEVGTGAYEIQLLSFPRPSRWDIIDCAAYITEMLNKGKLYFYCEGVKDDDPETVEKEYDGLREEYAREEEEMVDVSGFWVAP